MSSQTSSPRLGGNCWSRDLKVRRLLRFAQVEYRPSWAPPISMDQLSSAVCTRQSALTLIALKARTIRCWFRFAWPGRQSHRSFGQHTNTPEIQVPLLTFRESSAHLPKTHVLSAKSLKTPALKGQGRHRLTWRRLCLLCQASAIYEFDLNQDLWWHFAPEQSPTP